MANLIICVDADRINCFGCPLAGSPVIHQQERLIGKGFVYWVCGYEHRELLGPHGECAEGWRPCGLNPEPEHWPLIQWDRKPSERWGYRGEC